MDLLELLTDYDANGSFADMAKNVNTTDGDGYAWYVRITDLENPKPLSELKYVYESSYKFLKKTELHGGELLMAKRGDIGKVYIFEPRTKYATVAPNMYLLKLNDKVIPHFLYDYFVSEEGNKKLTRLNASSTMGALYKDDVKNIDVIMPSIEEQDMIGNFFQSIDRLITLHQRKYEEMKTLKRYMLQKMFPQSEQKVPEIRFAGFTEDWEQRKFADFTWDAGKRNKEDLDLEPYAITNEHGFIRQCDAHDDFGYMKDTDRKAYNIVQPNSFAYNPARINVGSIGYYKGVENVIVSSLYEVFQTDNYVNDRFLWHWLKSDEFPRWIERLQEGSVRLYFYYDKLCECQLYMPSLEEQEKIASFLDALDHLITLHQRKYLKVKLHRKQQL